MSTKAKSKVTRRKKKSELEDYDYEATYTHNLENLSDPFIDSVCRSTRHRYSYVTKTIKSGNQFEVEIYPVFKAGSEIPEGIVYKKGATRKEQQNLNDKNSRKRLERLIHSNFGPGDLWVHFTFDDSNLPADIEGVHKEAAKYFRRLAYHRKKKGLPSVKYIYVAEQGEYGTERFHLHIVMDSLLDRELVEKLWGRGLVTIKTINYRGEKNLLGLCKYLVKDPETYKKTTFRLKGKREWRSSKGNLKKPKESKNRTAFSKKKVVDMVKNHDIVQDLLEARYRNYNFRNAEIKYNDYNGMFYIYARMEDKRNIPLRI